MKNIIATAACLLGTAFAASAAFNIDTDQNLVDFYDLKVERVGEMVEGSFYIDASKRHLKSNQEVTITPYIHSEQDSYQLSPVTVAGRNRYYYHLRNDAGYTKDVNLFHNTDAIVSRIPYSFSVPFENWMNHSTLSVGLTYSGCCGKTDAIIANVPIANFDMAPRVYSEQLVYEAPTTEKVKIRQESGSAFIDFKIGKADIDPNFRNNPAELAKIKETIDAVRNDKDLTIKSIAITGFASPDGSEALNNRLAAERAASLLAYVKSLYNFPKSVKFSSEGKGEDWAGVRDYLQTHEIANRQALLDIVDNSALTQDQKDARMKAEYPSDYAYLLENLYPSLRRSDYVVEFTVKEYTNVNEIVEILQTNPRKLSLNEIFIAAETMEPGSDDYNNAFITAVTLFPNDETANLNAASVSINKRDYAAAEKYLAKAGNSDNAMYARGVLAAKKGEYEKARDYFRKAKSVPEAKTALSQVEDIIANPEGGVNIKNFGTITK